VVGRRLLIAIPVLWGVTFLTFVVLNALPGDAATALLGANATPAEIRAETIKLHLNEPLLVRYWNWLVGVLHGNLGTSLYYNQPVTSILGQRLPVTLELVVYALVITFVVSVPLAIFSARRPRGVVDRTSMVFSMASLSVAPYVLALLLILVFAVNLQWFPALAQGTGLYRAGHRHRAQPGHAHRGDRDRGTDLRVVRHRVGATAGDQQPGRAAGRGHRAGLRHHRRPGQPSHRPDLRRARPKDPSWPFP
jgi:ABC-type dipeptide/oligopeptide/nickel transport system permease component